MQPMTLTSVAIAGLLAAATPDLHAWYFTLAATGALIAHAANNMINDLFDLDEGLDTSTYPRALYAPHPVLTGITSRRGLLVAILAANALDLAIMLILFVARGWPIVAFALTGLFISVGYVAPPLRLKRRALGEPSVALIWGPVMVGGTYYAATGALPSSVLLASIPYSLLVTSVLMGKHLDKDPWDRAAGVVTLPVLLGERPARRVTGWLMAAFYVSVVALIGAAILPAWCLIALASLPLLARTLRTYAAAKPESPPAGYPVWPLWFAPWAFVHARRAGALLVVGLALGVLWPAYV